MLTTFVWGGSEGGSRAVCAPECYELVGRGQCVHPNAVKYVI